MRGLRVARRPWVSKSLRASSATAFSATFEASAAALSKLCDEDANNQTQRKRALVAVADFVSDKLANTRSVARSSYIHPKVTQAFESGKLRSRILKGKTVSGLTRMESALMRFLRGQQKS